MTLPPLRPYQRAAVDAVVAAGAAGHRRVVLVAPTGSGKTRMGLEVVSRALTRGRTVLWVAHRTELVSQPVEAMRACGWDVGVINPSEPERPSAPIQVGSVQSILARGSCPPADLIIPDEFHHYVSDMWGDIFHGRESSAVLGLTATPERSDGAPLGDIAGHMVVAASYPDLVRDGHLVPCRVLVPVTSIDRGVALGPVEAYLEHGEGRTGFVFCPSVAEAERLADAFNAAGVPSVCVSERSTATERKASLEALRAGTLRLLTNVYALTEGVDIPSASVCILARKVGHASPYLQMVGRVLRTAPGKTDALLIDLCGSAELHGHPCMARDYSLVDGITPSPTSPGLRQCIACGHCWEGRALACPRCGYLPPMSAKVAAAALIAGVDLRELPPETAEERVKREVLKSLRTRQREAGYKLGWVMYSYERIYSEMPVIKDATKDEKRALFCDLEAKRQERGYAKGWTAHRYRSVFGVWPRGLE